MSELVILVDKEDKQIGSMEKLLAHQKGLLHRAFSVFIFNSKGELLLQRRNIDKYHSGGLWSNSCCSHPRVGEQSMEAAERRLNEEMGMKCKLSFEFSFIYRSEYDNGLVEHEYDHVFFGTTEQLPLPNEDEVMDWKYIDIKNLQQELKNSPHLFTSWLKICYPKVLEHLKNKKLKG